jgi:hypothetical protein
MTRDEKISLGTLVAELACMLGIAVNAPDRVPIMALGLAVWCNALVAGVVTAWRATCRDSGWPVVILVAQVFMAMLWLSFLGVGLE